MTVTYGWNGTQCDTLCADKSQPNSLQFGKFAMKKGIPGSLLIFAYALGDGSPVDEIYHIDDVQRRHLQPSRCSHNPGLESLDSPDLSLCLLPSDLCMTPT
jgi:hypothetical protein